MSVISRVFQTIGFMALGVSAVCSQAFTVTTFSPKGEVRNIQQVRATFSTSMIRLGNITAPAPFDVSCPEKGEGHWVDDRSWVMDFHQRLPGATSCRFTLKPDLTSLTGEAASGDTVFEFTTGPLAIEENWPETYQYIEEQQAFAFRFNGKLSAKPQLFCQVEDSPEQKPMVRVSAADKAKIIEHLKETDNSARIEVVRCGQRLPAGKKVTVVLQRPGSKEEQTLNYQVRSEFSADFSCDRENANAACIPLGSFRLNFSAQVPLKLAQAIRLKTPSGERKPDLDRSENKGMVSSVSFAPPFDLKGEFELRLPDDFIDESGRKLVNASSFPLPFKTGDAPPLAKFAAAPFGIIELNADPAVAVTLRDVEGDLDITSARIGLGSLVVRDDHLMMRWLAKVNRYHESWISKGEDSIETRRLSLLANEPNTKKLELPSKPGKDGKWPFSVVGIPVSETGLHVLELKSSVLGQSLLGENKPMYVRTAMLVTNMAVHLKRGRDNAAVWVTTLDKAKPVAGAEIHIYDCHETLLWQGKTAANGVASIPQRLEKPYCSGDGLDGLFVTARKKDDKGREDVSFVRSEWDQGIESWRFAIPTDTSPQPNIRAHTVFDRTLFRAGETVSMKHYLRIETAKGLAFGKGNQLPDQMTITHDGSGEQHEYDLRWRGNRYAESSYIIPKEAKLGTYSVVLTRKGSRSSGDDEESNYDSDGVSVGTGSFRVEEFRLPVMRGQISTPPKSGIAPKEMPVSLSMSYGSGGPAQNLPVQVSAMLRERYDYNANYEAYRFTAPESLRGETEHSLDNKVVLDKSAISTDANGNAKVVIKDLPAIDRAYDLVIEATYADPNGEIQTLSRSVPLWPSAVKVGLAVEDWVSVGNSSTLKAIVLDTNDKPVVGRKVVVKAVQHNYLSTRKRLVGGFYAYDHQETTDNLGTVCKGETDKRGLLICDIELDKEGSIELIAEVDDGADHIAKAAQSIWVTEAGQSWFDTENNDRIDILPEKPSYEPGETARLQVRMPFREATVLLAIEREGIIETRLIELTGKNPTIDLKIKPEWGPNVFVSVLAVRARITEVPWYSFFTWGWRAPVKWWKAFWGQSRDFEAPTALVDLAKPAFKYGITELKIGTAGHQLKVTVTPEKSTYAIRKTAYVKVQVKLPNGKPAPAGTEVAFAAVDEALLELQPNHSWDLLETMLQRRSYGVETATAQLQVVGKRHFGRKALTPGGGGGVAPTRELLDTLLLWKPNVILDAKGSATIAVPINDALTRFKLVAVADSGTGYFGTGSGIITVTQDVQLMSGLPPVVRHGDQIEAGVTVRNGSSRAMTVKVEASAEGLPELPAKTVKIPAGEAREVSWPLVIPNGINKLNWILSAKEQGGENAADKLAIEEEVETAVPVAVMQATLQQITGSINIPVGLPATAEPNRGGVKVLLQDRLAGDMPGVREWLLKYPYSCLEQRSSIAIGLGDTERWAGIMRELPAYLDSDGMARYFPAQAGYESYGSDTLTAYLLAVASDNGWEIPEEPRERMLNALTQFVEGRLTRQLWMPRDSNDARRLAAMEALARYGKLNPRQVEVITIQPNSWNTQSLLDWMSILQRVPSIPEQAKRLADAEQILRGRLTYQGTRLVFSTEKDDYWWWLMGNSDVNAARLLLTVRDLPSWKNDMPRLVTGLLGRQQKGAWWTTTANAWGTVAVRRFGLMFENTAVAGKTQATLGENQVSHSWNTPKTDYLPLPWPANGKGTLNITHEGSGQPWATIQVSAALPLTAPLSAGYKLKKTVTPVQQKTTGVYSRGDVLRVTLDISAQADMNWVVVDDPIPAGASLLGSGLGRDSAIATSGEKQETGDAWPAYIERRFSGYRAYYEYVPRGSFKLEYTVRLNNAGAFRLPPTRVEAMYAPDVFGANPNALFKIGHE